MVQYLVHGSAACKAVPIWRKGGARYPAVGLDEPLRPDHTQRLGAVVRQLPPPAGRPDHQSIKTDVQTLAVRGAAIVSARVVTWDGDVFAFAVPFATHRPAQDAGRSATSGARNAKPR